MRSSIVARTPWITLLIVAAAAAAVTKASAEPVREEGVLAKARPIDGEHDLHALARFHWTGGWLHTDFHLPAEWATADGVRTRIKGSAAMWVWKLSAHRDGGDAGIASERVVELTYEDAGDKNADGHTRATLYSHDGYLAISGRLRCKGEWVVVFYRGRLGSNAELEAYVQEDCALTRTLLNSRGPSLADIAGENPDEVDRYFAPVLRKLSRANLLGPGAADVYELFAEIPADPVTASRVEEVLPALDSPHPAEREEATKRLTRLGRPAVLAAMRWDPATLSAEQQARLARFIDDHRRRRVGPPELARLDLTLLTECLADDDLAVRSTAKAAIEQVLGRPIEFDPNVAIDRVTSAIEEVRAAVRPAGVQKASAVTVLEP